MAGFVAVLVVLAAVLWMLALSPALAPFLGAGRMARYGHSATMLGDGTLLVAGGMGRDGPVSSAILYNPATDAWQPTGNLADARYHHSATLLPNGKVLVAGGFRNLDVLNTAELYDPASGIWSPAGKMAVGRATHAATLLASGNVLVAGGAEVLEDPSSAEVFDPELGGWSATGGMVTRGRGHRMALLPNGEVLVVGGCCGDARGIPTEIYEPATRSWKPTGSLESFGAVFSVAPSSNGRVLALVSQPGGQSPSGPVGIAFYDPAGATWSSVGTPSPGPYGYDYLPAATPLSGGKVLVSGATMDTVMRPDVGSALAELYDPASDSWEIAGTMTSARAVPSTTLLRTGKTLVVGGWGRGDEVLDSAEGFDPATKTWSVLASMGTP